MSVPMHSENGLHARLVIAGRGRTVCAMGLSWNERLSAAPGLVVAALPFKITVLLTQYDDRHKLKLTCGSVNFR